MLELAIRGAKICQLTIKDLPTALAPHPAAMIEDSIRKSSTYEQTRKD